MNLAVIGSGGREHALVKKLADSSKVGQVYALPGNIGTKDIAINIDVNISDFDAVLDVCKTNKIEWVVVGPENPLANGIADFLSQHDIKVFGPKQKEAQMESSKDFTKQLMQKYNIPTATFRTFTEKEDAKAYIISQGAPIVLKQDGLAAGKGVIVAQTLDEALTGLDALKPTLNNPLVIEGFLTGEEFSLMILVNGEYFHAFEMIAQDHKRAFDGDTGPNTGGMGVYAPVSHISEDTRLKAVNTIVEPITKAMVQEGLDYFGVLYLGAIVNDAGDVDVIEFNARFGDPEAQILLEMMDSDLFELIEKTYDKEPFTIDWKDGYQVGVMLASQGYPGTYKMGKPVDYSAVQADSFVSGLTEIEDKTVTSGGRVLLVTAHGEDIKTAQEKAYNNVSKVKFNDNELFYRKDIGNRALNK